MNIIWLFLPVIAWGILPLVITKLGGTPINQIFGTAIGTLMIGLLVQISLHRAINIISFLAEMLAGAFWIIGQLGQYTGYTEIGVSKTMPISTGLQLVGTALIGVILFGEWQQVSEKIIGALGILLLIIGTVMTSYQSNKNQMSSSKQKQTIMMLTITTIGFVIFNAILRALSSSGIAIFLPESIGMVVAVTIYLLVKRDFKAVVSAKSSWLNVIDGFIFSIASLAYIMAVNANGVNTAFVISQLSVVVSTIGGMVILKEQKSARELIMTLSGLFLIIIGAVVTTVF